MTRLVPLARPSGSDEWTTHRRDELVGELRQTPALHRLLRAHCGGEAARQQGRRPNEERFDGKFMLRTDDTPTPTDLALACKQL